MIVFFFPSALYCLETHLRSPLRPFLSLFEDVVHLNRKCECVCVCVL